MTVPLIRSAALAPIIRWLEDNGRDPYPTLQKVDLGWYSSEKPLEAIPLRFAAQFLCNLARVEGPDIPRRIVADKGFFELGLLTAVGLTAYTPRGVFSQIVAAMANHCTHEVFNVDGSGATDLIVTDGWMLSFDDETLHVIQQYCVAIVEMVCSLTSLPKPLLSNVYMVPHPNYGLDHLRPWLGDRVSAHQMKNLRIAIPYTVADAPIALGGKAMEPLAASWKWVPLQDGTSASYSVALLLTGMLRSGEPSIDRVASAVGISRRSLQRSLEAEGTTFSEVLDNVRRRLAQDLLRQDGMTIGSLASGLGYKRQSAFTRAFRRWQGEPPSASLKRP